MKLDITRKNFEGDKIQADREVRGEPKECNVPKAKKEGSAARRQIKVRTLSWSTLGELDKSMMKGMQEKTLLK